MATLMSHLIAHVALLLWRKCTLGNYCLLNDNILLLLLLSLLLLLLLDWSTDSTLPHSVPDNCTNFKTRDFLLINPYMLVKSKASHSTKLCTPN